MLPIAFGVLAVAASVTTPALGASPAGNVTLVAEAPTGAEPLLSSVATAAGDTVAVWAVPLREGPLLPLDYVATCARLGMRPVCEGGDDCEWSDDICVPLKIEEDNCGHPLRGLHQKLAASSPDGAPLLEGICNYEGIRTDGWDSGACVAAGGRGFVPGNLADGARRAACAGPAGDSMEAGFLVQAGQCTVSGACVTSPNELGIGDSIFDGSGCIIVALHTGVLKVQGFVTGSSADVLTVRGQPYGGSSGPDGIAVSSGDVLAWTSQGLLEGDDGSRWRICIRREDAVDGGKAKKLTQEVRQDHHTEAALRRDLAAAKAKAKAEEEKERATARLDGQWRLRAEKREADGRLQRGRLWRAVARLQGSINDARMLTMLTTVMLLLLLALGAFLAFRKRGRPALQLGGEGALAAPLLAADGCQALPEQSVPRSPPGLEAGGKGSSFEPQVMIIDYSIDGIRTKCVKLEAPTGHMPKGYRTIRGSVQELAGTGIRIQLLEDSGAAAAEPGALESGRVAANDGVGVWERTLTFEDGPWEVQDTDFDVGQAFDRDGHWRVHLVRRLPGRSFPICPHVQMSPRISGDMPDMKSEEDSLEEYGEEYVSSGLISEEGLDSPDPEPPVTPQPGVSRASSCEPHSNSAPATEWHMVTGSKDE